MGGFKMREQSARASPHSNARQEAPVSFKVEETGGIGKIASGTDLSKAATIEPRQLILGDAVGGIRFATLDSVENNRLSGGRARTAGGIRTRTVKSAYQRKS